MSELNEINGIVFGGKKYTVGGAGEVPEGLIDPMDIEWGVYAFSSSPHEIREIEVPTSFPFHLELPDYNGDTPITSIGGYGAFRGMGIKSVKLPNYLESIGGGSAFESNQLTSIVLPDSLTSIGSSIFRYNQITSLVIPDSVTSIGAYAFEDNQITSVVIPDSVESIGNYAFRDNPLEEVSMHIDTTLGSSVFPSSAVITARIPEGYIFGEGLTDIGSYAYSDMGLTGPITIAGSVTSIGDYAFRNNQLTSIVIPDTVTSIESRAFYDNPLEEVSISVGTTFTSNSFPSSAVITYRIPEGYIFGEGLTEIGVNAYLNNGLQGNIVIADSVERVDREAFRNNSITSVTLPETMDSLGQNAFRGNNLTSLVFPAITGSLGFDCFADNEIESVTFLEGGRIVGGLQNNKLTTISIPDSVETIGTSGFQNNQLTSVVFGNSLTSINNYAFNNNQLTSITLPDSLTSIGSWAFLNNQLTSVVLPDSATSIGVGAFENNQLTSVVIPDSVTSIDMYAFAGNPLEEVSIHIDTTYNSSAFPSSAVITVRGEPELPDEPEPELPVDPEPVDPEPELPEGNIFGEGLTDIGSDAYKGKGITGAITIADGVTSIDNYAFENNQITSVVFPDSLTSIGFMAFDTNQLTSVVIPDSVTSIDGYAFDVNLLTEVSIGPNTTYESSSFPDSAVITVREN